MMRNILFTMKIIELKCFIVHVHVCMNGNPVYLKCVSFIT
jgi:hypothetical protein